MADFADAKRILVRSTNWLGDGVMSLPALRAVRRAFPGAHLGVMIQSKLSPLFEGTDLCDEVVAFERPRRCPVAGWSQRSALYSRLREGKWDLGVLFPNSFSSAWFMMRGGVARRVGYAVRMRGWTLTDAVPMTHGPLSRHQVHYYLQIASFLGAGGDPGDCHYEPPAAATETAGRLLGELGVEPGSFVAMAPAAAYGPAKEWPTAQYAELARLLVDRRGLRTLVVGSPSEMPRCAEVASLAAQKADGVASAAGRTSVAELAAVFRLSAGFVGNDSGAMHLAGATGVPTVGIFGSTQPSVTAPLGPRTAVLEPRPEFGQRYSCRPCLRRTCRWGNNACFTFIRPEDALDALTPLLDVPHGGPEGER